MTTAQYLRQEGMQQGMHTESLEVAKNMLTNMHSDMQTVSRSTGLNQTEIIKLREEKNSE